MPKHLVATVLATALGAATGCGGGGGFIDAGPTGGTITFSWTLVDANQALLTCTQIGAESVVVTIHDLSNGGSMMQTFSCDVGRATSLALLDGTYSVDFSLHSPSAQIATAPSASGITISNGVDVPVSSMFPIDATGGLKLLLATGATAGNCATTAAGGAGITGTTITLQHNDVGACAPVTFAIAAGATQAAGSYTVDCSAPVLAPCIDDDQQLSVTGVVSGRYTIHITGSEAALSCWTDSESLQVPAFGADLTSTLHLTATGTPGC